MFVLLQLLFCCFVCFAYTSSLQKGCAGIVLQILNPSVGRSWAIHPKNGTFLLENGWGGMCEGVGKIVLLSPTFHRCCSWEIQMPWAWSAPLAALPLGHVPVFLLSCLFWPTRIRVSMVGSLTPYINIPFHDNTENALDICAFSTSKNKCSIKISMISVCFSNVL